MPDAWHADGAPPAVALDRTAPANRWPSIVPSGSQWTINSAARYHRTGYLNGSAGRAGRRCLEALLVVHDLILNEGAAITAEMLTGYEMGRAVVAYYHLGLTTVGDLLMRLPDAAVSPVSAVVIDIEYRRRLPDDAPLLAALRRRLAWRDVQ